ncbi:MAG: hypothetical protein F6J95_014290 [Leptolyngbya sp. SIO1E4]|nr:hypothetical protein [Leptolyngbya sp. SIO1E4]
MEDDKEYSENTEKPKRKSRTRRSKKAAAPLPALPPASPPVAGVYKVQVFYLAARNTNPKAPIKDALWFATYPIIPRVGDCLFHDGVYYQVERVFLYENMGPGWYADVEVSFYGRR